MSNSVLGVEGGVLANTVYPCWYVWSQLKDVVINFNCLGLKWGMDIWCMKPCSLPRVSFSMVFWEQQVMYFLIVGMKFIRVSSKSLNWFKKNSNQRLNLNHNIYTSIPWSFGYSCSLQTPLHYAAVSGQGDVCLELLLKDGANPNLQVCCVLPSLSVNKLFFLWLRVCNG